MVQNNMEEKIIDVAQALVQSRGEWFSYRDLADRILIRTSSIHYYCPKKDDLACALMQCYRTDFDGVLQSIDHSDRSPEDFSYLV